MYIFRPEFRKTIVTFKISTLESVRILSFDTKKNKKTLNLRAKLSYLDIFGL